MSAAVAGLGAAVVVLAGCRLWAPPPRRVRALVVTPAAIGPVSSGAPLTRLGAWLLRRAGVEPTPRTAAAVGMAVAAATAGLVVGPAGAVVGGAGGLVAAAATSRMPARRQADALVAELPDLVDLLAVAVAGGLTVRLALEHVTGRGAAAATQPLQRALVGVMEQVRAGDRLADALLTLPETVGDAVRPLVTALVTTERTGAPLLPALQRLATEYRVGRRRRAEERARSLPVKLLFPLVLCVLPAFGLLTVVPLIAGALRGLQL